MTLALVHSTAQPIAKVRGAPLHELPPDLYIPPEALEVFLETFEGPLDLLLYLIRKADVDILDIPIARLTEQYLAYVETMRSRNLELAAEDGRRRRARPARRARAPPARVRADETGGPEARPAAAARPRFPGGQSVDRAVARDAPPERERGGPRERVAQPARPRAPASTPPGNPRRALGARAHGDHPPAARRRRVPRVRRAVRPVARCIGAGRDLPRAARACARGVDRRDAGRAVRADLREAARGGHRDARVRAVVSLRC